MKQVKMSDSHFLTPFNCTLTFPFLISKPSLVISNSKCKPLQLHWQVASPQYISFHYYKNPKSLLPDSSLQNHLN